MGTTDVRHLSADNPWARAADQHGQDDVVIASDDLHLPVGKPVKVLLRSLDVLHDFYVPEFRQDGHGPGMGHLFLDDPDPNRNV